MIINIIIKFRNFIQIIWTILINGYIIGFLNGSVYSGKGKNICVPGLNCYACPGALYSCPIGSLQVMLANKGYKIPFYVIGILLFFTILLGRITCGFLCPFGLVQDLLYKIPFKYKKKNLPFHEKLKFIKYFILLIFVIILPYVASRFMDIYQPWFCKYICPQGSLSGGIPFIIHNTEYIGKISGLFYIKMFILILVVLLSIYVYRPFCKYICPLGAIYAMFEKYTLFRIKIDENKCINCKKCEKECNMSVKILTNTENQRECIKCGKCIKNCPRKAINFSNRY